MSFYHEWSDRLYIAKTEVIQDAVVVADEHVAFYRDLLVAEAQAGIFDLRSRSDFLVAIGARALMNSKYKPDQVAGEAFASVHSLVLMEAHDPEMAFWTTQEWTRHVKRSFDAFQPRPGEITPADDTYTGYIEVAEALRKRGRYPVRHVAFTNAPILKRRYVFTPSGSRFRDALHRQLVSK